MGQRGMSENHRRKGLRKGQGPHSGPDWHPRLAPGAVLGSVPLTDATGCVLCARGCLQRTGGCSAAPRTCAHGLSGGTALSAAGTEGTLQNMSESILPMPVVTELTDVGVYYLPSSW